MQQRKRRWKLRKEERLIRLYARNDASMQLSLAGLMLELEPYAVHVRNTPAPESGTWASTVKTYREVANLSQQALADAVQTDRSTVWRWENRNQRPESYAMAKKVIDRLAIPKEIGFAAAGFADDDAEPDPFAYIREMGLDPANRIVRRILGIPNISDEMRMALLRREREYQLRDEQRRLEEIDWYFSRQTREAS